MVNNEARESEGWIVDDRRIGFFIFPLSFPRPVFQRISYSKAARARNNALDNAGRYELPPPREESIRAK